MLLGGTTPFAYHGRMWTLWRLLVVACWMGVSGARASCDLAPGGEAVVVRALDAETLALEDGRQVRLANMISPRRPLWLAQGEVWHAADAAHRVLELLVRGRRVRLSFDGGETDRRGRLIAHVHVAGAAAVPEVWVQAAMIADGRGRVTSSPDGVACVADLLGAERLARAARRGVWGDPHYRVHAADAVDEIARLLNHFHLVEGVVHAVAARGSRIYLNFAPDWRTDFTVIVARRDRRHFEAAGIDLEALAGRPVRVRGFVRNFNGPAIDATHPGQIEILDSVAK